jgi:ankyrin repeat protein
MDEFLNEIIIGEHGVIDSTGNQQDCLGMTPLHILACSSAQCLELYKLMVEKYPYNLIVEDSWGAIPLLYALWGDASSEVVQFWSTALDLSNRTTNLIGKPC